MATVPTGKMERELRKLYLRWVAGIPAHAGNLDGYIDQFRHQSTALINKMGGKVARLGVVAGFPAPKELNLSPVLDHVYDTMKQAAIKAGVATGLNARDIARGMLHAGLGQSYSSLERLARTEVVSAYWANQWDSVEGLDLVMVWSAEHGPRTCPYCISKDGLVVEQSAIRDHPNGRCTLKPTLPSRVPLRDKGKPPRFLRSDWDGTLPENKEFNQALRGGLDRALVQSRAASQAVTGMVSQGWTSSQAAHYMTTFPGMTTTFTRADWSLTLRALESYADDLWKGLGKGLPSKLYRGGAVNGTGLSSWTAKRTTADAYHMRNGGVVYEMDVPGKLLGYKLRSNAGQEEYLALGTPRVTEVMGSVERGVLDGPTPYRMPGDSITVPSG